MCGKGGATDLVPRANKGNTEIDGVNTSDTNETEEF